MVNRFNYRNEIGLKLPDFRSGDIGDMAKAVIKLDYVFAALARVQISRHFAHGVTA